jgi:GT2 family glycosyltransferase
VRSGPTAIVIPVFNGMPQLDACLRSLAWTQSADVAVVVVDAGSTDGSPEAVRRRVPEAHLVHGSSEMWWTASIERGCREALEALGAQRLCLLNHDCEWGEDSFLRLMASLDAHPHAIVCSCALEHDGRIHFGGGVRSATGRFAIRSAGVVTAERPASGWVAWCGGMGSGFSSRTYEEVGGFDSRAFPHYWGDLDFCLRARRKGIPVWYEAGSVVSVDPTSTGISVPRRRADLGSALRALTSRKSAVNLSDTVRFYARHTGWRALVPLAQIYGSWTLVTVRRLLGSAAS